MTDRSPRKYRLAVVTSHPVQYQSPLFQRMAADDRIDLTVFYGHDGSVVGDLDREFSVRIQWDRPLLEGYQFVFLTRRSDRLNALQRLVAEARIIAYLWQQSFDAVLIHSYATRLSLFAYGGAIASRTPVLLRTESELLRRRSWWVEALKRLVLTPLFALTAGVLVIGKMNRSFFEAYGVDASRHFFTPYSVDNTYFAHQRELVRGSRCALRHRHGWADDVVVVGFSGKLIPGKRVEDLIDAVAVLQDEGLRTGLLIIGDGPSRPDLEERVRAGRLKWTVFAGFKNQSEISASYACLDVFVLPSGSETWGLVVNEAMVFGLPVVATTMVGASADLVEQGRNGHVFEAGHVDGLVQALRQLITSPETRRRFGEHSETIVQRYSYDACLRGILEALRHVTRRPRAGSDAREPGEADL